MQRFPVAAHVRDLPEGGGGQYLGVSHLLANGNLADVLLFGAFLAGSVLSFRAARARDLAAQTTYPAGTASGTAIIGVVGAVAWGVFAFWAHTALMGVRPL
ncbi:MAG: hypothetical protein JJD98_18740 [Polaromonas sp.]|nr:hypothetical protein [Polaromonas sp.]